MAVSTLLGAMINVVFFLVFLGQSSVAYVGYFDDIETRLTRIENKLDVLTNEVDKFTDDNGPVSEAHKDPITLLTVDKTTSAERTEVQVRYLHNVVDVDHETRVAGYVVESTEIVDDEDSFLLNISCNSSSTDCDNIMIEFANADRSDGVQLVINASRNQPPHQDLFRVPVLQSALSEDLVYYIGGDAQVKVTASSGHEDPSRGFTRLQTKLQGTYLKSDRFQYLTELVTVEGGKQFIGTKESTVKVETSDEPLSGFLSLSVTYADSAPALVRQFTVMRNVIVRPTNQMGPLPDGFISFTNDHTSSTMEEERTELCPVGSNCTITCVAVAESLTDIKVTKKQNMEWIPVSGTTVFDEPYRKILSWTVEATPYTPDTRYKCEAEDHTHGTSARQDVRVILSTEEITFVPEKSGVELLNNGTAILHCVVSGRPVLSAHLELQHPEYYVWSGFQTQILEVDGNPMETDITAMVDEDELVENIQIKCHVYKYDHAYSLSYRSYHFDVPRTHRNDTGLTDI